MSYKQGMGDIAISVEDLSKRYRIGLKQEQPKTLVSAAAALVSGPISNLRRLRQLSSFNKNGHEADDIIWALKDVSFGVKRGEVLGIIGRNGAGKSTLLKVLSRITEPTKGCIRMNGRVSSLLEVGTGFHPELTGRENVYLNGTILGMRRQEISRKFDEIVDFSGVEKVIDTPVKRYSSGMKVRLAFAVAAHLEPEIFIVDEVLAVGDAEFQRKCLGKMGEVAGEGRTVLLVSHNMSSIGALCSRVVWLEAGQKEDDGPVTSVIEKYLSTGTTHVSEWITPQHSDTDSVAQILSARALSADDRPTTVINFRQRCNVEIILKVNHAVDNLSMVLVLNDALQNRVWVTRDTDDIGRNSRFNREPGLYRCICKMPTDILKPGAYNLTLGLQCQELILETHESVLWFDVSNIGYHLNPARSGAVLPPISWEKSKFTED